MSPHNDKQLETATARRTILQEIMERRAAELRDVIKHATREMEILATFGADEADDLITKGISLAPEATHNDEATNEATPAKRQRRKMSKAARAAIGRRMRAYWRAQRKAKKHAA